MSKTEEFNRGQYNWHKANGRMDDAFRRDQSDFYRGVAHGIPNFLTACGNFAWKTGYWMNYRDNFDCGHTETHPKFGNLARRLLKIFKR